jgi:hypothetical protein
LAARLEHARIQFIIGPDPVPLAAIRRRAEEAVRLYAEAGDESGRQRASFLLGCVQLRMGQVSRAEGAFRRSLMFADRTGQLRERLATRWLLVMALAAGRTPVTTCIQECGALTETLESGHPGLLIEQAILSAMQGQLDEARRLNQRARHSFLEEMRARRMLMFLAQSQATVECLARPARRQPAAQRRAGQQRSGTPVRAQGERRVGGSGTAARLTPVIGTEIVTGNPLKRDDHCPTEGRRNDRHDKPAQRPAFRPLTCTFVPL